ncbi:LysR family transcriptional regulator [Mycolicibacillus koreensis]|uniref:LysR family transcriptional regulator n=1 Tax=Mycolicibacillus koreensis TaxID=1069220 RepID=UPI00138B6FE9|nr:LysR family transcriptional regulator [Mycolicibacillus koreensis]BBY53216.1 LysR family transcriptional regulator [Mycolicibacillus koreensis]
MSHQSAPPRRPDLDLRRLTQFVAVVDAGGFTRAAALLHLSQQALSSAVRQLEKDIGAELLVRAGRQISLTPAGRTLLDEGRALLAAADTLAQHARAAARLERDEFVVAHTPAIDNRDVYRLLEATIAHFPTTSFTVRQVFPADLVAGVHDGTVHLGLRRGVVPQERLAATVARYDPLRVAVAATHPLAGRRSIGVIELAAHPIVLWSPPGASYYSDFLVNVCRRAGFEPRYRVSRVQGCPPEAAALTDDGVVFVTAAAGPALGGTVHVIDLDTPTLVPMQALWQPHTVSLVREAILRTDDVS